MHIRFSALLAGIFLALSVDARPSTSSNSTADANVARDMVKLPLKRVEQRSDIHPLIALQQNINRSHRRYARMTGRELPSTSELHENLRRRVLAVEGEQGLVKRYNRNGTKKTVANTRPAGSGAVLAAAAAKNRNGNAQAAENGRKGKARKGKGKGKGKNEAAAGAGAGAGGAVGGNVDTSVPDAVAIANTPTTANSLGLDIESQDLGYLATIQMGTPPQDYLILMDSGSADLWVGAENCASENGGGCGNHNFLGPKSSSSFVDTQAPFQVTYGSGAVQGNIITDNIVVAGLALNAHTFGVASTESVQFSDNSTPFDGLMGLAQSTLSEQGVLTPIEAMAKAGLVPAAITSYKISRLADNKNDGEITFGGLDTTKFNPATLVTLPNVSKQGFWESAMDSVSVDGTDLGLTGRTAILDTGTTLIIAPPADALAVHQAIAGAASDGQGGFTVPCTTNASVALTFGGATFAIDTRDLAFQPVDPTNPTGDCVSGISAGNIGGAQEWLVGDVFLKNAYFSTDVTKNTLSLAQLV